MRSSTNFKKNKNPVNVNIDTIEMKNTIISQELDLDLQKREQELNNFNLNQNPLEEERNNENNDSDDDTIYETMMDIQYRRDDSKTFFDNEIDGIFKKKLLKILKKAKLMN